MSSETPDFAKLREALGTQDAPTPEIVAIFQQIKNLRESDRSLRSIRRNLELDNMPVLEPVEDGNELDGGVATSELAVLLDSFIKLKQEKESLSDRLVSMVSTTDQLEAKGLSTTVADLRFAKPLDSELIRKLMATHEVIVTIEEGSISGLGAHVLTLASDEGLTDAGLKIRTMRLPDAFLDHDAPDKQYDEAGLNAPNIVDTVLNALRHNSAGVTEARA